MTTTANSTEADKTNGTAPSVGNTTTAGTVVQTGFADATQTESKATTATTTKRATTTTKKTEGKSENMVEFIGRFQKISDTTYKFEWAGSTITAGFTGTEIGIRLRTLKNANHDKDYFNVSIDGGESFLLVTDMSRVEYTLATGLKDGYHTVRVTKRTEAQFSSQFQFEGFLYGSSQPAPAPARKTRRIEIYGDSISAGYGNEAKENGFRLNEENIDKTYGALAAAALDAEYTVIALSGHGMYESLSQSTTEVTPKYFDRILHKNDVKYKFDQPAPDVVVIHLGTNDANMGVSMADYRKAYLRFVANIRRQYPDAYIVCTTAGGNTTVWDTIDEVVNMRKQLYSDVKIGHFIYMYDDIAGTVGADGHPSVYGHQQIGDALTAYIQEKLGW
ncbi:MAG: hypothetical protein IJ518_05880 [Clostridia bacterium]|nr:hypothetical protein [Clostridia bacterium]